MQFLYLERMLRVAVRKPFWLFFPKICIEFNELVDSACSCFSEENLCVGNSDKIMEALLGS